MFWCLTCNEYLAVRQLNPGPAPYSHDVPAGGWRTHTHHVYLVQQLVPSDPIDVAYSTSLARDVQAREQLVAWEKQKRLESGLRGRAVPAIVIPE